MPICLITGCDLWVPAEGKLLHGDLHMLKRGNAYVFNGVLDDKGDTAWQYLNFPAVDLPRKLAIATGDYFDRRGVICIGFDAFRLNEAATDYVQGIK